jgi:hypothetical protein
MFRFALVVLGLVLFVADADACTARAGLFSRTRSRIVHRERVVDRTRGGLLGFGLVGIHAAAPTVIVNCAPPVAPAPMPVPDPKKPK